MPPPHRVPERDSSSSVTRPTPAPSGSNRSPPQPAHGPSTAPHREQVSPGSGLDPHTPHWRTNRHRTHRIAGAYPARWVKTNDLPPRKRRCPATPPWPAPRAHLFPVDPRCGPPSRRAARRASTPVPSPLPTPASSASQLGTLPTMSTQNRSTAARVRKQIAGMEGGGLAVLHGPSSLVDQDGEAQVRRSARGRCDGCRRAAFPVWPHACDQALVTDRSPWSGSTSTTASPRSPRNPARRCPPPRSRWERRPAPTCPRRAAVPRWLRAMPTGRMAPVRTCCGRARRPPPFSLDRRGRPVGVRPPHLPSPVMTGRLGGPGAAEEHRKRGHVVLRPPAKRLEQGRVKHRLGTRTPLGSHAAPRPSPFADAMTNPRTTRPPSGTRTIDPTAMVSSSRSGTE